MAKVLPASQRAKVETRPPSQGYGRDAMGQQDLARRLKPITTAQNLACVPSPHPAERADPREMIMAAERPRSTEGAGCRCAQETTRSSQPFSQACGALTSCAHAPLWCGSMHEHARAPRPGRKEDCPAPRSALHARVEKLHGLEWSPGLARGRLSQPSRAAQRIVSTRHGRHHRSHRSRGANGHRLPRCRKS